MKFLMGFNGSYLSCFFFLCQAAGLAPTLEQIEMLSQQLPDASLVKLYASDVYVILPITLLAKFA